MKPFIKFILSVIILIACCAIADCLIGVILDKMIDKVPNDGNEIGAAHFAIKNVDDPVLIIGSSRAKNHYYPDIITDSLSLDTYNLGRLGHYVSYSSILINLILERYSPQIVIWELGMDTFFSDTDDRVNTLKPYYWDNYAVREVIGEKEGQLSRIKLLSNSYRYNGTALDIIHAIIVGGTDNDPAKGMTPIKHTSSEHNLELTLEISRTSPIDQARVNRFHNAIQRLVDAGVKVIVFDSPHYALPNPNRNLASETIIRKECERLSIPIFDNRYLDYFLQRKELFRDNSHLFEDGAEIYTQIAAHQIVQEYRR